MKRITSIITMVLYFALSWAYGQNNVAGYQYWFDTNFTQSVNTAISPIPSYNLNSNISTAGLPTGIHTINIRFWDDSLHYSSIISQFFLKTQPQASNTQDLVAYQFWFDTNFTNANTQSITATSQYNLSGNIDATALPAGIHTISFRFQHSDDSWSSVITQFFLKNNPQVATNNDIVEYQYWYDTNFTTAVNTTVPSTSQLNVVNALNTTSLPDGIHTFSIRFKHSDGNWSSVLTQFFLKKPAQSSTTNEITEYQYWYDTNFTTATNQTVTATQQLNVLSSISTTAIPEGIHTFSIRFKHDDGVWSSIITQFFLKHPPTPNTANKMVSYRYWFDTNFTNVVYVPISPNASSVTILDGLNMTQIPKGIHQVSFQFKDSLDMWSVVSVDSVMKASLPVANFSFSQIDYCDSTVVSFTDLSIDAEVYHWNFGDGDTSNLAEPSHTYLTPGTYTVSQMVSDPSAGLDSTISLTITIDTTATFATISVLECDSYVSPSGNYTWLTSGNYQDTISNTAGCDSVITVNLTIHNSTTATVSATVCDEYTAPSGALYITTGIYQDTIANTIGCDSVITINLTVLNSSTSQETVSSCGSYTSPSGIYTWTSSGTYLDTLTNSLGCDSVITVNLTILQSTAATINPVVCDEYISPSGITWNVSGNYSDTIPNLAGCDSIITINLTVLNSTSATLTETACFSYVSPSGNEVWTSSGTYVDTLQNSNGCDSVVTVNLTINTVDTLVTESGFTLTANSSTGNFQWIDCADMTVILGETNQSFTATVSGIYALEITDNGCTDTSSCHSIMNVGVIENSLAGQFVLYPNPTSGLISIKVPDNLGEYEVLILDLNGKLLRTIKTSQPLINLEINGASGMYFIEVISDKGETRLKVVKH